MSILLSFITILDGNSYDAERNMTTVDGRLESLVQHPPCRKVPVDSSLVDIAIA
jgi:hypothetical protein